VTSRWLSVHDSIRARGDRGDGPQRAFSLTAVPVLKVGESSAGLLGDS